MRTKLSLKTARFLLCTLALSALALSGPSQALAGDNASAEVVLKPDSSEDYMPQYPGAQDLPNTPMSVATATTNQVSVAPAVATAQPSPERESAPVKKAFAKQQPPPKIKIPKAKEFLAQQKMAGKDGAKKLSKLEKEKRQKTKELKKAKADVKSSEARAAAAKKIMKKIELSLKDLDRKLIAQTKALKKMDSARMKDTRKSKPFVANAASDRRCTVHAKKIECPTNLSGRF